MTTRAHTTPAPSGGRVVIGTDGKPVIAGSRVTVKVEQMDFREHKGKHYLEVEYIAYCFGVAAEHYGLDVYWLSVLSNHYPCSAEQVPLRELAPIHQEGVGAGYPLGQAGS